MKNMNTIIILVLLISIIGSISGYCQNEYFYDYDKYVEVEYSDNYVAIEKNESLADWSNFFDENDYLERLEKPFPMPNGMYLMKLKQDIEIGSALDQLSEKTEINEIIKSWKYKDTPFLFPTNKIVVYFKEKMASRLADSIASANDIKEYRMFLGKDNCYLFKVEGDYYKNALNLANKIYETGLASFSKVGVIFPVKSCDAPNDPLYPYQWNLNNTGQGGGTPGADIGMEEAWEYTYEPRYGGGLLYLRIVILDDGIADHEDLLWSYSDTAYYDNYPSDHHPPGQYQSHGQAIAGILTGIRNNGVGVSGMLRGYDCNPNNCQLDYPIRCHVICGPDYPSNWFQFADNISVAEAIYDASHEEKRWALAISISYSFGSMREHIDTAIVSAYNNGTTIFASAGNTDKLIAGSMLVWPARMPEVIAVGASDYNDHRSDYSMYGLGGVDFLAPSSITEDTGVGIISTDQMGIYNGRVLENGLSCIDTTLSSDYMCDFGGTSAACPQAAAIAMMIFARRGDWRYGAFDSYPVSPVNIAGTYRPMPEVIREIIRFSSEDVYNNDEVSGIEDTSWINEEYGWGRVNAARALLAVSRGDVDNNAIIDSLDYDYIIQYKYYSGPDPEPNVLLADANCSGTIDVLDVVYIINYVHKGGPRPPLCYKY